MLKQNFFNEEELLLQLSLGDKVSFDTIYRKYSRGLLNKLIKILKSPIVAEDILHDVFITVWDNREKIDSNSCFQSYLSCIAINKCYDHFRKIARTNKLYSKLITEKERYSIQDQFLINKEESTILFHTIELLPPKRRLIFRLCKLDGKSYEEVSKQLNISLSTISDHIVKANTFIRTRYFPR